MSRIQRQHEEHCQLALLVLPWISKAQRPLRVVELQHAEAVEDGNEDIDDDSLASEALILSVCAGLTTIDVESGTIHLVHFTVEEYFERTSSRWFPQADKQIVRTCLTYLSFTAFGQGICTSYEDYEARVQKYQLFKYAATHWRRHFNQANALFEDVQDVALHFLGDEMKVAASKQTDLRFLNPVPFLQNIASERVPGFHLVVKTGNVKFAASWQACGQDINAKDSRDGTALEISIEQEDLGMTRLLVDFGVDINERGRSGKTPLMIAASHDWLDGVDLLV